MLGTPNAEKAGRYLGLLDTALCNGSWGEIAELARKVDKHAPDRKCLTLAARAEAQVASASNRPTSASSATATSIHGLSELVPVIRDTIPTADTTHPDDAFIGRTCLAQIYWLQEEPLNALEVLAHTVGPSKSPAGERPVLGWLEVCEVKRAFVRAACLNVSGSHSEARESYQAAISRTPGYRTPELRRWTERLLGRACMHSVKTVPSPSTSDLSKTYAAFRAWNDFWQRSSSSTANASTSQWDVPRRQVWKAYYDLLSTAVQHDLLSTAAGLIPAADLTDTQRSTTRRQHRAEILRVETVYESLLLAETKFPKASQSNAEVEEWTQQVIGNWRIFTTDWTDLDLGEGGRSAVSRNTLEILYRASTKTFHSTAILRQLFTVHSALGDFDLAMHAFDSYVEIVDRGKARAEKTGKHEIGFDDDDTAMITAIEAIRLLCRYGDREQAEKANEIVATITKWMAQKRPSTAEATQANGHDSEGSRSATETNSAQLKPPILSSVYRAMGISQAHWAHLTFDSSARPILLAKANKNLRHAQELDAGNIDTAYSLALVLLELRDVAGALEVTRKVLDGSVMLNGDAAAPQRQQRERQLLSFWHLLALELTAQDKYETAAQICAASYQQFANSRVLLGGSSQRASQDMEKAGEIPALPHGVVDQMDGFEKESLLQIRMSQILLVELMDGPDIAIDLTDSLLGLYSRLFGSLEQVINAPSKPPKTAASATPSRFGGTLRSITGSIRPRSARSRRSSAENGTLRQQSVTSAEVLPTADQRGATNGTGLGPPIAITVTSEDGSPAEKSHHRHHLHLPFHGRHQGHDSPAARSTKDSIVEKDENHVAPENIVTPLKAAQGAPEQPLQNVAHNAPPTDWPSPAGHTDQPPVQDVRSPVPHPASASAVPETHLLPPYERRHRVGVLINTWIFVSQLYLRADCTDDAQNAVEQASKLIAGLEKGFASQGTNARRLFEKGWGGVKSVDELWADVWATKAHLALAQKRPFEALSSFEKCLSYYPDHANGIIGLSELLLDIFEEKLPAEESMTLIHTPPSTSSSLVLEATPSITRPNTASSTPPSRRPSLVTDHRPEKPSLKDKREWTPAELNRLAARDRAYMLLSNLTKQGTGWDNPEAWYTLARAHELSREIDKAKQALWWVVELEENRPLRPWREIAPGGHTL